MDNPSKNTLTIPRDPMVSGGSLADLERDRIVTLGQVRDLEEAARSIREKGFTARSFESICATSATLGENVRRHETMEERHLFPGLRAVDPGIVRAFETEHRAVRALFGTLLSTIRDIEAGRIHGSSVGDLLRAIGEIVTLLRRHIIHEGDVLASFLRQNTVGGEAGHPERYR